MKFAEILGRLNGVSTPIGGISWDAPTSDMAVAKKVIVFLEDRRALYSMHEVEVPHHVLMSVEQIRHFLTDALMAGGIAPELTQHIKSMRAACRKFMSSPELKHESLHGAGGFENYGLNQALGELRGSMGWHIAAIAAKYQIDVEDDLASILPFADEERSN